MPKNIEPSNTRDRLIAAMVAALRTRGYHGVGLNEVLAAAQAPKGVLYHHFPAGKSELAVQAIEAVGQQLGAELEKVIQRSDDPVNALSLWMNSAQKMLEKSGFQSGCPLATIALESTPEDDTIRRALAQAFAALRSRIAKVLDGIGLSDPAARSIASLIVSAYEGALLQARVSGNVITMRETSEALISLLRLSLNESKNHRN